MTVAEKAIALLGFLSEEQIRALPLATRQRLAQYCRHVAEIAEPPVERLPKSGVLADLRNGIPRYE